jgi:hypothetical protein
MEIHEIVIHRTEILEMAKQVKIKSIKEVFLFLIQFMLFIRTMNPFPKIPMINSTRETTKNKLSIMLNMSACRENLPLIHHGLMNSY